MENFDSTLTDFVDNLQHMLNEYYTTKFSMLTPPIVQTMVGKKYVKIVLTDSTPNGSRVHCFIEKSTGNIYKAASWKAPQLNHVRGNIFVSLTDGINVYGANYLK